jgi:hypothetical protein
MITRILLVLVISAVVVVVVLTTSGSTQTTSFGYCMSYPSGSPVYVSNAFDFGTINLDTNPIQNEFNEYLRGRFGFRSDSSYGAACPASWYTIAQAQNAKRDYENQLRQQNKQIIEVDWTYIPDPRSLPTGPLPQHRMPSVNSALTSDHTFCFSETYSGTVYYTGPVQTGMSVNLSSWNIGFTQHLKQRYSFPGKVNCNMGPRSIATRLVNAYLEGARAANKKIVDAGWHYDPNVASNNAGPAPEDEDREPARPPGPSTSQASQSELQQARMEAQKERPAAMEYCRKDPILSQVFSCPNFASAVVAYRVAHHADAGSQPPLDKLLGNETFRCTGCVNGVQVMIWVNHHASAEKLNPQVTTCTVRTLTKTLNNNTPRIRHLEEFYKDAVGQCSH